VAFFAFARRLIYFDQHRIVDVAAERAFDRFKISLMAVAEAISIISLASWGGIAGALAAAVRHRQAAERACRSELWLNPNLS